MNHPLADEMPVYDNYYVITLSSTSVPMPLEVPFVHELVGFSVFRSRGIEEGRERFRLHVGYFDSRARAFEALPVVRRYFPAAEVSPAPGGEQSSLDDTLNTSFRIVKSAHARVVRSEADEAAARQDARRMGVHNGPYTQRFVIQLDWTTAPIDVEAVPDLPIFHPYNLYTVRALREDRPYFGLRLGFFKNFRLARQVAEASRSHYPSPRVLPISPREFDRAVDVVQRRARTPVAATPA